MAAVGQLPQRGEQPVLQRLGGDDPRCTIKRLASADGTSQNIGDFFRFCDDPDALYLRLDDDIVFTEPGFLERFKARPSRAAARRCGLRR